MNITVFGMGYVGLVTALCFAEIGHKVRAVDIESAKLAQLRRGICPIYEQHLPELLKRNLRRRNIRFLHDPQEAVGSAEAVFLCVGTPVGNHGRADLTAIFAAVRAIAPHLRKRVVIIAKSTVPVGSCERLRRVLRECGADLSEVGVACNPEFLKEGTAVEDFMRPDRIVLGSDDDQARTLLRRLYEPLLARKVRRRFLPGRQTSPQVLEMSTRSAELLKMASNAFLATKISYINAIANIAESTGADISDVAAGMGADPRIGRQFLQAGIGYGGSCFPKDVEELRRISEANGQCFDLLNEVQRINTAQRDYLIQRLEKQIGSVRGLPLAVLGLSFKAQTDDVRCSPAIAVVARLLGKGAKISAYDPAATERARQVIGDAITFASSPYHCMADAHAMLILTDWPEFQSLELSRVRSLLKLPVVVDGRNLYRPADMASAGLIYLSVGRRTLKPRESRSQLFPRPDIAFGSNSAPAEHLDFPSTLALTKHCLQTSDKTDIEV